MTPPVAAAPLDVFTCPLEGTTLIEASAGTGKTWAMTGLVLRLIIERGLPIQNILVVTFTQAATAELRERVRERLREVLQVVRREADSSDPFIQGLLSHVLPRLDRETLHHRLSAALASFDEAAIFTIHGYCQRALGDAPLTAGQPFEWTLVDDQELLREVSTDFWRNHIATLTDPVLAAHLARTTSPEWLETQLRRRLSRPLARYVWEAEENEASPALPADPSPVDYPAIRIQWQALAETAKDLLLEACRDKHLHGASYKPASIEAGFDAWTRWFASPELPAELPDSPAERWGDRMIRAKTNKGKTTPEHPLFTALEQLLQALTARARTLETARLSLLRTFLETAPLAVQAHKKDRRQASFDDLLKNLHQSLGDAGETLAQHLRNRYPAALIDEFQDTDPLQFDIFRTIYSPPAETAPTPGAPQTLFLVGDPKQAIYSFRQADLQTYLSARNLADRCYYLPANQRSSQALITAVNALFSRHDRPFMLDGLTFQPVSLGSKPRYRLRDHRPVVRAALHGWQLPEDPPLDKGAARQLAAQACAREMADLLAAAQCGQVYRESPEGQPVPLAARDLAVLVRTHAQGQRMKAALARVGLGATELATGSIFAAAEAAELETLLFALAEPGRPERLRAALATPWIGLEAHAIHDLARNDGLTAWQARFQEGHQCWQQRGLAVAMYRLMAEWGISARILELEEGERKLTNLLHLIECLHAQARDHRDPPALLRWLAEQRANPLRAGDTAQLRLESDENLIRILTIHRAKGLEFPVVFCPFIGEGSGRARPDDEGLEYPLENRAQRCIDFRAGDHPDIERGRERAQLETAAEDLRLLYVALTRAVDRCYLVFGPYLSSRSLKDSQRALLHWLVAGRGDPAAWIGDGGNWAAILEHWQALAAEHPDEIRLAPVASVFRETGARSPANTGTGTPPAVSQPPALPPPLPVAWRLGSFSGLLQGRHAGGSPDRDIPALPGALPSSPAPAGPAPADDDILWFARGARAGECIHAVFERADFGNPETWTAAIEQALQQHPPGLHSRDMPELSRARLRHMLQDVVQTPLPGTGDFRLSGLGLSDRLNELEFSLPVARLSAENLSTLCRQFGIPLPPLDFSPLEGYLRGFIDLVFRFAGPDGRPRYALIDWKSNYLGPDPRDYGPEAIEAEMLAHGYYLQALIYTLALHRHLRCCLPDYDPGYHLAGAYYLFVRGVRPDLAPDNRPGIRHWQVPVPLLDALERLIGP